MATASATKLQLKPLADRVVVKKLDAEEKTAGGIVLPDTAKEKPQQGEVLAVGPGKLDEKSNSPAYGSKSWRQNFVCQVLWHRSQN